MQNVLPERIVGIENEYGVVMRVNGKFQGIEDSRVQEVLPTGLWLPNGSRVYVDTGSHPEYASPECRSIRDAVLYDRAGERIMAELFRKADLSPSDRILLFKNNRDVIGVETFGCHENYLVYMPTQQYVDGVTSDNPVLVSGLVPFLVSRIIFAGSGWWDNGGKGPFLLSQRTPCLTNVSGGSTTANRALVSTQRQEHHSGSGKEPMWRLHLIMGDSNMLEFSNFLKLGTTSLVLALIEAGRAPRLKLKEPLLALQSVNRDLTGKEPVIELKKRGRYMSALTVQKVYYRAVRAYVADVSMTPLQREETRAILESWNDAIVAFEKDDADWPLGRIDWFTKRYLTQQTLSRFSARDLAHRSQAMDNSSKEDEMRKSIDLLYHAISEPFALDRIHARWPSRRLLSEEDIWYAMSRAPGNTRAALRARAISLGKRFGFKVDCNWDKVSLWIEGESLHLEFSNPFALHSRKLDEVEKYLEAQRESGK